MASSSANVSGADWESPSVSDSGGGGGGLSVTVVRWQAVAGWKWLARDDECSICKNPFDACCNKCKLPGDDCPLVWGQCSHCFHMHCILQWLNTHTPTNQSEISYCPLCKAEWKFKE